jgi:hypothetical protein
MQPGSRGAAGSLEAQAGEIRRRGDGRKGTIPLGHTERIENMRGIPRLRLTVAALVMLPFLMGTSCSRDIRDAAWGGVLSYISGTVSSTTDSLMPFSTAFANLFAGPTGEQDQ